MSINKIEPVNMWHTPSGWTELHDWINGLSGGEKTAANTAAVMAWNLAAAIQRNQPEPTPYAAEKGLPAEIRTRREEMSAHNPDNAGTVRTVAALCGHSIPSGGDVDAAFRVMWTDALQAGAFDNCGDSYGEIAAALLLHRAAKFLK